MKEENGDGERSLEPLLSFNEQFPSVLQLGLIATTNCPDSNSAVRSRRVRSGDQLLSLSRPLVLSLCPCINPLFPVPVHPVFMLSRDLWQEAFLVP